MSIILSSNEIQNGDILVPANPGSPGKMAVKTETDRHKDADICSFLLYAAISSGSKLLLKPSCSNYSLSSSSDVDVYFKASTKKNNKEVIFAPTNLHLQRMSVFNTALQTSKYNSCDDISCGRDAHFCVDSLFNRSNNLNLLREEADT